jgi:hypothetical protein
MRIVQEVKFQLQLLLYNEVSVLKPDQQEYEYLNSQPPNRIALRPERCGLRAIPPNRCVTECISDGANTDE